MSMILEKLLNIPEHDEDLRRRAFDVVIFIFNNHVTGNWFSAEDKKMIMDNMEPALDILVAHDECEKWLENYEKLFSCSPSQCRGADHALGYELITIAKLFALEPKFLESIQERQDAKKQLRLYRDWQTIFFPLENLLLDFVVETQKYKHDGVEWEEDFLMNRSALDFILENMHEISAVVNKKIPHSKLFSMYATYCEHVLYQTLGLIPRLLLNEFAPLISVVGNHVTEVTNKNVWRSL